MRTYIAKNLQRCCKAIRNAVKEYNAAAQALNPPRDPLDWSKVSHYTFLEEFPLLQGTHNDLQNKPWATPAVRETMRISRRIASARVEVANVSREARRVQTHIRDEEALFSRVLGELKQQADPLYGVVMEYAQHQRAANARTFTGCTRWTGSWETGDQVCVREYYRRSIDMPPKLRTVAPLYQISSIRKAAFSRRRRWIRRQQGCRQRP